MEDFFVRMFERLAKLGLVGIVLDFFSERVFPLYIEFGKTTPVAAVFFLWFVNQATGNWRGLRASKKWKSAYRKATFPADPPPAKWWHWFFFLRPLPSPSEEERAAAKIFLADKTNLARCWSSSRAIGGIGKLFLWTFLLTLGFVVQSSHIVGGGAFAATLAAYACFINLGSILENVGYMNNDKNLEGLGRTVVDQAPLVLQRFELLRQSLRGGLKPGIVTVAIIDDDDAHLELMQIAFASRGHRAIILKNSKELSQLLSAGSVPDVLLCDLGMPGLDCVDVAALVRANRATLNLPIVAISGDKPPGSLVSDLLGAGYETFLLKPHGDYSSFVARAIACAQIQQKVESP